MVFLSGWKCACMYKFIYFIIYIAVGVCCGLNSRLNTFVPVLSHDLDFHRYMSYFMLSPPQPCTNIKTKSTRGICLMLKIFRLMFGETIEVLFLHTRWKIKLLGESKMVDLVMEMDQYMTRSLDWKRVQ